MEIIRKNIFTLLTIIWLIVVTVLLLLPPDNFDTVSRYEIPFIDKVVHIFLFGSLYLLAAKAVEERMSDTSKAVVLVCVIIYAIFTEYLQLVLGIRSFEIFDIIANIMGATIAYLFFNRTLN